jgi:hypothetical protein
MGDPLTVVILVAAGGATDPTTYAIERAASQALGRSARVVAHESVGAPSDSEALAASPATTPAAIVEVTWGDGGHRVASLRVHLSGSERWLDRTIGFGANDADAERARTIGFALASMIPESETAAADASGPPTPAAPAPEPANVPATMTIADSDRAAAEASSEARRFALDFFAIGAAGLEPGVTSAATGGGGGALEAFVLPGLSLRFGGAVRAGSMTSAQGTVLTLLGTAGLSVHPWRPTPTRPVAAALRVDYVIQSESVSRESSAGMTTSTHSRALSGADVLAEFEWQFASGVELVVGGGVEETFATTYIDLNGARVATLPPLGAVAEAGLRLPF